MTDAYCLQGQERIIRAIEVYQNGGPEVLKLHCLEIGKPGPGQALVRLVAARVNFVNVYQRRGTYPRKRPFVPGLEGAGVVEAVGEDVKNLSQLTEWRIRGKLVLTPKRA
jgi:NADPH:quinone reductase